MKFYFSIFFVSITQFIYTQNYNRVITEKIDCTQKNSQKTIHFQRIDSTTDIFDLKIELLALSHVLDTIFPNDFDYDRPLVFVVPDIIPETAPPLLFCEIQALKSENSSHTNEEHDSIVILSHQGVVIPFHSISMKNFNHPNVTKVENSLSFSKKNKKGKYFFVKNKKLSSLQKKYPNAIYKQLNHISYARKFRDKYYVGIGFADILPSTYKVYDFRQETPLVVLEIPDVKEFLYFLVEISGDKKSGFKVEQVYPDFYQQYLYGENQSAFHTHFSCSEYVFLPRAISNQLYNSSYRRARRYFIYPK